MKIAERILKIRNADGESEIPVSIFIPEQDSDGAWFCAYEIGWPDGTRHFRAGGIDSAQALISAVQMISAQIYTSKYHESGQLYWEKLGSGYGFPVMSSLRDMLIGDDAKYF